MNGGGIKIGRLFGIPIIIDTSWLVIFFLITWAFWGQFRLLAPTVTGAPTWVAALVASLLFFTSVLIHELSHSVVSIRRDIPVNRIRLFIFGGVSEISEEAATPQDEFAITIAGPLASFVLAAIFYGITILLPDGREALQAAIDLVIKGRPDRIPTTSQPDVLIALVPATLAFINAALGVFNLLPGFPLDGGRILRSIVWRVTGSWHRATVIAIAGGRALAFVMITLGLFDVLFAGDLGGLWYVLLGWFLMQAANSAMIQMEVKEGLAGVTAGQVMTSTPVALPGDITLQQAFDDYIMAHNYSVFPVVIDGRVRGTLSLAHLREVPRAEWPLVTVAEAMTPLEPDDAVPVDAPVDELVQRLAGGGRRVVVVQSGRLVGIISPSDITRWMQRRGL